MKNIDFCNIVNFRIESEMFGQDIGIDLGTATIIAYVRGKGIVLREPSVVAVNRKTDEVLAVGNEARRMIGRTPDNIIAIRPLEGGVISEYKYAEKMLKTFLNKISKGGIFSPRVMVCVPSTITEVEKKAVIDVILAAGAKKVYLIQEPIAAAIGAGLDISKPYGNVVIDVGGGTTDIAVIALDGAVVSKSVKIAGDNFDEAIIQHLKKKFNLVVGKITAEEAKKNIGTVSPKSTHKEMEITGRDLITGLPKTEMITSKDMYEALSDLALDLIEEFIQLLESTPPELVADISSKGIYMTGGGSLIDGMDKLFEKQTGINVVVAEDALSCVAVGTGKALEKMEPEDRNIWI